MTDRDAIEITSIPISDDPSSSPPTHGGTTPWSMSTLFAVGILGGFIAAGIIAALNWRRLGKSHYLWLTLMLPPFMLGFFFVVVLFIPPTTQFISTLIGWVIGLFCTMVFWLWQRNTYKEWKKDHPNAGSAGIGIPLLVILLTVVVTIGGLYGLSLLIPIA